MAPYPIFGGYILKKLAQVFHTWYTDRWNAVYADANEPGWAISDDVAKLLNILAPSVTPKQLRAALKQIAK